ncbi:hypothetical protein LEP1GSC112_0440 [Leptospira interrogans serovar Pomona str. UT364]|nr:hypothetical protein LEP1GSC110_3575 [Leptospira interrogans serovar Medanensis str. UT053]EMO00911.1 hypothetical protein LEP1GSC112_0440 [Leptospira interrogans serovar Pomona str. UT364]
MSWHFSRALVEEYSAENSLDGEPFAEWKSTPSVLDDSCSDKMKDICHRSPFGMMFVPSTDVYGADLLTWYRADFLARTSQQQEEGPALTEKIPVSGKRCSESFAKFDRASSSWKIPQCLPGVDSIEFSGPWPQWVSMRNAECYQRKKPELHKFGKEFGLLPTPRKSMGKAGWGFGKALNRYSERVKNLALTLSGGWSPSPEMLEAEMGWPIGWTAPKPLAMDKFQQWLDLHGLS